MPGLTVTEKEHWKNRIAKRIERKIETLKASDPGFFTRVTMQARQQTLDNLGLAELTQRLEATEKQEQECQKQKVRIEREMVELVFGTASMPYDDWAYCLLFAETIQALHSFLDHGPPATCDVRELLG